MVEAEPVVEPAPVQPVVAHTSCESEIYKYQWDYNTAIAVARAESGLNPNAVGDTSLAYFDSGIKYGESYGCFQIRYLPGRPSPEYLLEAANNVQYAHELYKRSGWSPWSAYNNGMYRKYL